jgi:ankyrin repeat protein
MIRMLLDAGAEAASPDGTGKPPIVYAAAKGFSKIVAIFLEEGVPVDIRDGNDLTPLMWAAGHPNDVPDAEALETISILLENGADIDLVDNRGRTALMIGAERGHSAIVSTLIAAGADPSITDKKGLSASELAVDPEIARMLDRR